MTTTRRDFLTAAVTAAGVAAAGDVGDANHSTAGHDHQAVPSDFALRVTPWPVT